MTIRPVTRSTSDRILAARLGQPWAWEEIYTELAGPVSGYLRARGAGDVEDLTSEVFLQVARDIHRFTGDDVKFRSWVFVIAHRRLIDSHRARARRPQRSELSVDLVEASGGDVEEEGLRAVAMVELQAVLDSLTDQQKDVLTLRVIGDLSLEQTAEVMGKRVGAVKALQRRALASVKTRLETGGVSP